jgi:hypothetical protein
MTGKGDATSLGRPVSYEPLVVYCIAPRVMIASLLCRYVLVDRSYRGSCSVLLDRSYSHTLF